MGYREVDVEIRPKSVRNSILYRIEQLTIFFYIRYHFKSYSKSNRSHGYSIKLGKNVIQE